MASVMIRTPMEKFFSANDKNDQKIILTSGVNYVKKFCDEQGLHFAYLVDERKKAALTNLGINLHPVPFLPHSHPFCKILENNQLINILPGILGSGRWTFMSIKEGKVESIIKKSGGVNNNISLINRCICAKDFSRYDFTPEEVDLRTNVLSEDHLFPENLMRSLKGKKIFIHDEVHHWDSRIMINFLEKVKPKIIFCSVVYPPELLAGILEPQNKSFYDFKVDGNKLFFFPDGNRSEFYEQPKDLSWLMLAKRFKLDDCNYTVKLISSTYCHHLFQISRGEKITESKRFFSDFDTIDLKVIHNERFRYYDHIPIRRAHLEKVYTYLMCLKKPDVESAIAKLRQLMEDEQDTRVVAFFCKFARDVIEKFKGKIHLYETGWLSQIGDNFIQMLPNFWGRILSRWHGLNLFDFLFKLDNLRIEVELIDVDAEYSSRNEVLKRLFKKDQFGENFDGLNTEYLRTIGLEVEMDDAWGKGFSSKKDSSIRACISKFGIERVSSKAFQSKLVSRFHLKVGILALLRERNRNEKSLQKGMFVNFNSRSQERKVLMIKFKPEDRVDSYPEPFFLNLRNFSSKECPFKDLRWMKVHDKIWGETFCTPLIPDESPSEKDEDIDICSIVDESECDDRNHNGQCLENPGSFEINKTLDDPNINMEITSIETRQGDEIDCQLNSTEPSEVETSEFMSELENSVYLSFHDDEVFNYLKVPIIGDGNCFFRAICMSVHGNDHGHLETRRKFSEHAKRIGFKFNAEIEKAIVEDGTFSDTWMVNLFANVMNVRLFIHETEDGPYYEIHPTIIKYDDPPLFSIRLLFGDAHFTLLREVEGESCEKLKEEYMIDWGENEFKVLNEFVDSIMDEQHRFKANNLRSRKAFFFSEHEGIDYGHDKVKYHRNQIDSIDSLLPRGMNCGFNSMLVQVYTDGAELPMHKDDERVYDNDNILSINLRGSCNFIISESKRGADNARSIEMKPGAYIVMLSGFQKKFKHGVSECRNGRVNVTFRRHVRSMRGHDLIDFDLSKIRNGCLIRSIANAECRGLNQVVQALIRKDRTFWSDWIHSGQGGTIDDLVKAATELHFSFDLITEKGCESFKNSGPKFTFQLKDGHFESINERPSCVEMTFLNMKSRGSSKDRRSIGKLRFEHMNETTFEIVGEFAAILKRSFMERTTGLILSECYGSACKNLEDLQIDPNSQFEKEIDFICGFAGSGKSFSIQCKLASEPKADFLVICPRNELKKDWLEKVNCNEKKVRTFEVALTLNLSKIELIVIDELGLFPNGYLDLLCLMLINQGNYACQVICLFDPLQARYHSDLDDSLLDFQHDCDRLVTDCEYLYLAESRRLSSKFFGAFFPDIHLHNEGREDFGMTIYDSVVVAVNEMKKKETPLDLVLVASRDEKKALATSVRTLTFGEAQGLTVNYACIVLSEYSEKQDDLRWMVALTRARIKIIFVCMYRGGSSCFLQNNSSRLIGLFMRQSPMTINRMKLMVKGDLIPFRKTIGCSDEVDREERLEGDPFLKPLIFLGSRINSEQVEVLEPEVVEPIEMTHIPLPPSHFDQSINFDRIRAREHREFKMNSMCTKQFCEDFEHSKASGRQMTSGPMRFEAIYPRHKADDDLTFWMAVKKRLRFSEEFVERAKLKEAMGVGGLLYSNLKETLNLKFNWDQSLLDECVNDFEEKKLSKSKATLQAHSSRSDSDWKLDHIFLFMKSQLCTKYEKQYVDAKAGQTLACFAHCILVKFAPYCRYMEKQLRSQFPDNIYIHSGKNFNDLNQWVKENMKGKECIESDYEAFDASQDEYILAFEICLMEDMGMPTWFINDYIDLKCTLGCKLGHFAIMRFTGEFSTFLFNTLANMAFTYARYDCDASTPIAFAGDDMCMLDNCAETDRFEGIFEKISLKAKVLRSGTPMFCGWNLCKHGIFKEPALVYNRFMVAQERGNVEECLENYAIEVSYAYMLGEKLYDFLKEEERINYHQSVVRFIIKRADKLKTKVRFMYTSDGKGN
uniref:RNA dependent RNA polymerase n=1 Tax=Camellia japonica associated betaflexivirus 3 TaxID=2686306 RepID=A0A6B9HE53_9VIRU|nr:RNA dependent RNA polymerase [Camellia japonica associated betaflexivirus 3]